MSSSSCRIKRKLLPVKKAWKKLFSSSTLISRLKRSKSLNAILGRRASTGQVPSFQFRPPWKKRNDLSHGSHPSTFLLRRKKKKKKKKLLSDRNFAPVYVDELFKDLPPHLPPPPAHAAIKIIEEPPPAAIDGEEDPPASASSAAVVEQEDEELMGVDLRAEIFIAKFREQRRQEEMLLLARGDSS